jgi:hypothetical protein
MTASPNHLAVVSILNQTQSDGPHQHVIYAGAIALPTSWRASRIFFGADMAIEVLEAAKDARDMMVVSACRRVHTAWLLARRVERADRDLIAAFAQ